VIREPEDFDKFRTATETIEEGDYEGRTVKVLYGQEIETGDWAIASYHLPVDEWTEDEARAFGEEHDGIKFEPATGEDEDVPDDEPDGEPDDDDATDDAASRTAPRAALDTALRTLRLQRIKLALHGINQDKEYRN
jgi:hypothetical protein